MAETIWKFPLEIADSQSVVMPSGARILSAQMQGSTLCLWAVVIVPLRYLRPLAG